MTPFEKGKNMDLFHNFFGFGSVKQVGVSIEQK